MLTFNPENQTYSKLIHIDEFPEIQKKMEQIAERVKNAPVFPVANYVKAKRSFALIVLMRYKR